MRAGRMISEMEAVDPALAAFVTELGDASVLTEADEAGKSRVSRAGTTAFVAKLEGYLEQLPNSDGGEGLTADRVTVLVDAATAATGGKRTKTVEAFAGAALMAASPQAAGYRAAHALIAAGAFSDALAALDDALAIKAK